MTGPRFGRDLGPAGAQSSQLPDLSLNDLRQVRVERVFGASERLQPVTEAPASVTIVTAEDIRRYGYRTLADILRGVRGFYVSNDRNYSYVGARGFAKPGDYNTRILLLVNGHRVNDNVYDQASVGGEFGLDMAAIERVEIIRGPAASLYGTNAVFGVINVITRTGTVAQRCHDPAGRGNAGYPTRACGVWKATRQRRRLRRLRVIRAERWQRRTVLSGFRFARHQLRHR